ncbi:MAG: hypothetical protein WC614_04610 [bacterium]
MKNIYPFGLCLVIAFFICFLPSCFSKPERFVEIIMDSTAIIPKNDSVIYRRARYDILADTLNIVTTHISGSTNGRVTFLLHKLTGSCQDIQTDTTYNINWYIPSTKITNCDTLLFKIVNTSSTSDVKVEIKVYSISWSQSVIP